MQVQCLFHHHQQLHHDSFKALDFTLPFSQRQGKARLVRGEIASWRYELRDGRWPTLSMAVNSGLLMFFPFQQGASLSDDESWRCSVVRFIFSLL